MTPLATNMATILLAEAATPAAAPTPFVFWIATVFVIAALVLIVVAAVTWFRSRAAAGTIQLPAMKTFAAALQPAANRQSTSIATTQEAERLLRLMGEAEELCTRLGNELDEKAERLERVLARAGGMIGDPRLAPGAERATAGANPQTVTSRPVVVPVHGQAVPPPLPQIVTRPVGVPAMSGAAQQGSMRAASELTAAPVSSLDPLAEQIYKLADTGLSAGDIANRMNQHAGKVELILALRNS